MKTLYKFNILPMLVLMGITFLLIGITNHYILTVEFFTKSDELLTGVPGEEIGIYEKLQKWIYVSSVFYLIIKLLTITIILSTALYLNDISVPFKKILFVVTLSEFIFLVPAALKIILFHIYYPEGSITDWYNFYILSALSVFNAGADWHYLLETLNLFEVIYWFILAFGIFKVSQASYDRSLQIVLISYVPALFIWVVSVTFISLLLFPTTG